MFDLVKNLIPDGVLRAWVLATARHVATAASAATVTYLVAHGASQGDAASISQAVAALILGLASYGFSLWDVKNVDTKIKVAAATPVSTDPFLNSGTAHAGK